MQRVGDSDGFARWQHVIARNLMEAEERAQADSAVMHHKLTDRKEEGARCALCGGARFVRMDVPLGHEEFGGVTPCPSCGDKVFIHLDARAQLLARPYWHMTFEAWRERSHNSKRLLSIGLRFVTERTGFLYLCGSPGTGKTHMAAAMANRLIDQGYPARFITAIDMAAECRAAVGTGGFALQTALDRYLKARFLVIDDLGTGHGTPFVADVLYQVIDARYRSGAPFVITSNVQPEELGEARLASRLRDVSSGHVEEMYELDYRAERPEVSREETF